MYSQVDSRPIRLCNLGLIDIKTFQNRELSNLCYSQHHVILYSFTVMCPQFYTKYYVRIIPIFEHFITFPVVKWLTRTISDNVDGKTIYFYERKCNQTISEVCFIM